MCVENISSHSEIQNWQWFPMEQKKFRWSHQRTRKSGKNEVWPFSAKHWSFPHFFFFLLAPSELIFKFATQNARKRAPNTYMWFWSKMRILGIFRSIAICKSHFVEMCHVPDVRALAPPVAKMSHPKTKKFFEIFCEHLVFGVIFFSWTRIERGPRSSAWERASSF